MTNARVETEQALDAAFEQAGIGKQHGGAAKMKMTMVTDGACSGNPGPGGWAAILIDESGHETVLRGHVERTTNNQMELMAVLEGLKALPGPCMLTIQTDSRNVIGWLSEGWKRKVQAIRELCEAIEQECEHGDHIYRFEYVRGHSGDPLNERANAIAQAEAASLLEHAAVAVGSR